MHGKSIPKASFISHAGALGTSFAPICAPIVVPTPSKIAAGMSTTCCNILKVAEIIAMLMKGARDVPTAILQELLTHR